MYLYSLSRIFRFRHHNGTLFTHLPMDKMAAISLIQWNPSGKAREVSLKLQNLVNFHAPFFTNHVGFFLPLMTGHLFWKATILGGLYKGVPLFRNAFSWMKNFVLQLNFHWSLFLHVLTWAKGPNDAKSALVHVMVWCWTDKPLLADPVHCFIYAAPRGDKLTHWGRVMHIASVKLLPVSLVQIMACRLVGARPLSEPMLEYLTLRNKFQWNINRNSHIFIQEIAFENVVRKM